MTFIVNHEDKIYEKNLGEDMLSKVELIDFFNPDSSWTLADPESEG